MASSSVIETGDFTTCLIGVIIFLCWHSLTRPKNFPPGPRGLPLIGYIPFIGGHSAETFRKMGEKYGPVMSVQMGREDWVILNNYDTIIEALVKQSDKFSGRPHNFMLSVVTDNRGLIGIDDGPNWKALRKFGLLTLRGFGVGKKGMEEHVIEETPLLIDNLTKKDNQNFCLKINLAVSNIICRVTFGSRFDYNDKEFLQLIETLQKYLGDTTTSKMFGMMVLAPPLRFIPPFKRYFKETLNDTAFVLGTIRKHIDEHEKGFHENDLRDFIDAFLNEMKKKENNDSDSFNRLQLVQYIRDLFEAGTGTTSSTLCWAIFCFLHHPECQEKIYKEIEKTLGLDGIPTMKHRDEMPYTCAFIHELMRHRTLAPLSVFHRTNEEAILNGYTIPKNTTISPNLWAVHYDSKYFQNPREFRPERFLDSDGKFVKSNHVIPFSVGPRHCLGEQLARMEIFIFLIGIVQKLKIVPNPERPFPPLDAGNFTFVTYDPPEFEVIFEKR